MTKELWKAAPDGQIWACRHCSRSNKNRYKVGDESCFLNSELRAEDTNLPVLAEQAWKDLLRGFNDE